jgi:hypothetical protein
MENSVSHFRLGVQERESPAQRDRVSAIHAETEPTHCPVELKTPMGQTVTGHQLMSESFGVFGNHRLFCCLHF